MIANSFVSRAVVQSNLPVWLKISVSQLVASLTFSILLLLSIVFLVSTGHGTIGDYLPMLTLMIGHLTGTASNLTDRERINADKSRSRNGSGE